jgi:hypothetical protein
MVSSRWSMVSCSAPLATDLGPLTGDNFDLMHETGVVPLT